MTGSNELSGGNEDMLARAQWWLCGAMYRGGIPGSTQSNQQAQVGKNKAHDRLFPIECCLLGMWFARQSPQAAVASRSVNSPG